MKEHTHFYRNGLPCPFCNREVYIAAVKDEADRNFRIRAAKGMGHSVSSIARLWNISRTRVYQIIKKKP